MKTLLSTLCILVFFLSCSGTRPQILGIKNDKLSLCPKTPNCVSSFSDKEDSIHYRSAVPFSKTKEEVKAILKSRIEDYPRTEIIQEEPNYIYAEFTSLIMRYVDDVEFYIDEKNKLLHFRSASRLGSKDFGVNRKRIETILKDLNI